MARIWQAIKQLFSPSPKFSNLAQVVLFVKYGDIRDMESYFKKYITYRHAGSMAEACNHSNKTIQSGKGNCMAQAILARDIIKAWGWVALIDIIDPPSKFSKTDAHAITRIEAPGITGYFSNGVFTDESGNR